MLEQGDAERERNLELTEEARGKLQARRITRHPSAEAMRLRLEKGWPYPRRQTVDERKELVRTRGVAERQRRLERVDDSVLHALEIGAEGGRSLDRGDTVGERLREASFCPPQRGVRSQVRASILDVGRVREPREERQDPTGLVELAPLHVDVDPGLQHAEDDPTGIDLLLRELVGGRQHVVPAAGHEERVRPFRQDSQLERAASHFVCERERFVQVTEGFRISVAT